MPSRNKNQGNTDTELHNSQLKTSHTCGTLHPACTTLRVSVWTQTGQERVGQLLRKEDCIFFVKVSMKTGTSGCWKLWHFGNGHRYFFLMSNLPGHLRRFKDISNSQFYTLNRWTWRWTMKRKLEMHSWKQPNWSHDINPCLSLSLTHIHTKPHVSTEWWCQIGSVRKLLALCRYCSRVRCELGYLPPVLCTPSLLRRTDCHSQPHWDLTFL